MGRQRRSREMALQVLYSIEITGFSPEKALASAYQLAQGPDGDDFNLPSSVRPFAEELVTGVILNQKEIDDKIRSASENWRLERMSIVDRNVLRIAVFEMLYCPHIPPKVSINEAIDIAKKFGTGESGSFINGVLDHVLNDLRRDGSRLEISR